MGIFKQTMSVFECKFLSNLAKYFLTLLSKGSLKKQDLGPGLVCLCCNLALPTDVFIVQVSIQLC